MSSWIESLRLKLRFRLGLLIALFNLVAGSFLPLLKVTPKDLRGKTVIVTGANSGLGYSIALALAKQNATVYLCCRNKAKGEKAASNIIEASGLNDIHVLELDVSSLQSVRQFALSWSKEIDILVHNAGIATTDPDNQVTEDGLGIIYATNFGGSFLLTSLLEKHLAPGARIVLTSSTGQYSGRIETLFELPRLSPLAYKGDQDLYSASKLFQVVFARALQQRSNRLGLDYTAHAFTPGYSATSIFDKVTKTSKSINPVFYFLKRALKWSISSDQGAMTGIWLATTDDPVVLQGGDYWDRCRRFSTRADWIVPGMLERIWQLWCIDTGAKWE
ncbi:MAG: hypothetical protein GOMPHAMPRED_007318 [Gomphillus americanus]|uniref:Uncharacterized protein n=1 Tax=Gomphillus americanus TaxID=1940652 RepID=A0A8H3I1A0_9LECA|nr:MAG: hypothetical protein GOMPHAMPRED_007318 [Gomphillus americanus]